MSDIPPMVSGIMENLNKKLNAAGMLHKYGKGEPDLDAEQREIERAVIEKSCDEKFEACGTTLSDQHN